MPTVEGRSAAYLQFSASVGLPGEESPQSPDSLHCDLLPIRLIYGHFGESVWLLCLPHLFTCNPRRYIVWHTPKRALQAAGQICQWRRQLRGVKT